MKRLTGITAGTLILFVAASASAQLKTYRFSMDGLQETPPVATTGTGTCEVLLNEITGAVNVDCSYANLIGNANAAHIHAPAPPGTPAGVILTLSQTGGTSGQITGNGVLTPTQTQDVVNGLAYVNLHSTFRPGGEIRGQIVPEPTTLGLLTLACYGVIRRRR